MLRVGVARTYSIFFWVLYCIPSVLIIPFPFIYWYKKRVVDRNYVELSNNTLHLFQGRWFVLDDDIVYTSAVDHIKIDRSICGFIFGWCTMVITTRSGAFSYYYMNMKCAEELRKAIIA